ncbi:MAG: efflux RND transporter periplasmic adaptor subunit [Ignavibacteriaceae bacterium]
MEISKKSKIVLRSLILLILLGAASWFFIQSRNNKHIKGNEKDSPNTSSRVQVVDGITTIKLNPSEQEESGITTVKLIQTLNQVQLAAYGSVVSIQDLSKDVQTYEANKAQLAKSKESLFISKKYYERLKSLYGKKLASEQDFQTAQAAFLSDKADMNSAQSNLNSMKSSILEQWGNNLSNWIFNSSYSLQRLLSLNDVLIQISLPLSEMNIKIPGNIFIQPAYLSGRLPSATGNNISCRFVSSGHIANAQFQTKTLYYIVSDASLSGGMNVKAFLPVGKNLNGVIVPSSSIVWYQGKAWIYSEKSPGKFIRVEIDTENPVDNGYFIPQNNGIINAGAIVVINGAQLLLSEELTPSQGSQTGEGDND